MNKKIFSENCNLSGYTTIKVGGVAEYFAEPRSVEELSYLIKWANLNKQRCLIIGAGSILLPLWGTGAKNGESVSIKYLSFGTIMAHSWISYAFGKVTIPLKLM